MQACGATFQKPYYTWLNKWTFRDISQSEMVLEGKYSSVSEVKSTYFQTFPLGLPLSCFSAWTSGWRWSQILRSWLPNGHPENRALNRGFHGISRLSDGDTASPRANKMNIIVKFDWAHSVWPSLSWIHTLWKMTFHIDETSWNFPMILCDTISD